MSVEETVQRLRTRYTFVQQSASDPTMIVVDGKVRLSLDEAARIANSDCSLDEVIAGRARDLRARLKANGHGPESSRTPPEDRTK
jgi:hypothetical protein